MEAELYLWGSNQYGQISNRGAEDDECQPVKVDLSDEMEKAVATTASAEATQLWLGPSTTCFSAGHIVYARGNNNKSQLGCAFGGEVRLWREIFVAEAKVVQIGCGWEHTIILCESGAWFGAGSNDYHQLIPPCHRLSEVTRLHSFTQLWLMDRSEQDGGKMSCGEGDKIVALSTCVRHTLFLTANGRCWGIGEGRHGQLSERWEQLRKDSRTTSCATAVELHHPAGLPWKVVSAGHFHSLLLDDSGTLYACGRNKDGEVDASSAGQPMRSLVAIASSEVQDAATMWFSSLWLRLKDRSVQGCGRSSMGQLAICRDFAKDRSLLQWSAGSEHGIGLFDDGSMWTWGWNDHGQCGNGEKSERVEPTQLDELSRLSHQWQTTIVRAGGGHSGTLFLSPLT
mmetsp:Transcript_20200/g.51587  ORF Transcript_20200/g.51587 Transcript_20200/m.51587 type:complete len:398 (-) Transcript_20200:258-1451(-)|eukprot:CAMPEP_0113872064 /NCGR_PEP_ID=MMETSP0780_2-20120614/2994_1 /TAXON_ID=652834 /ORGANISM="Palpitomonas bilix" /LENGTH=397 /DNA_ID=CAMNT_0000857531 /DNA_START=205 /DNA_END=1398 /DNA_ORIENTATION=- /assembly_acc=CAM_ASM_000599